MKINKSLFIKPTCTCMWVIKSKRSYTLSSEALHPFTSVCIKLHLLIFLHFPLILNNHPRLRKKNDSWKEEKKMLIQIQIQKKALYVEEKKLQWTYSLRFHRQRKKINELLIRRMAYLRKENRPCICYITYQISVVKPWVISNCNFFLNDAGIFIYRWIYPPG